jgi:hypothetical protein
VSCRCEERSEEAIAGKNEIAAPFGLAMTVTIIISFVLIPSSLLQGHSLVKQPQIDGKGGDSRRKKVKKLAAGEI